MQGDAIFSIFSLDPLVERIESQIQEYAHEGLRTLCIAKRVNDPPSSISSVVSHYFVPYLSYLGSLSLTY